IERGPFYAVRVRQGSFGTFGGLRADAKARLLDSQGIPVPGVHVVGVDQKNLFGGHYPAGGVNIGPAMTFGYITGRELAGVGTAPAADSSPAAKAATTAAVRHARSTGPPQQSQRSRAPAPEIPEKETE